MDNSVNYRLLKLLVIGMFIVSCNPEKQIPIRECGTMYGYEERLKTEADFARNEMRLEREIGNYLQNMRQEDQTAFRSGIVVIPVVVHIVSKNTTENISDAQIQSQIDVLNEDFRRMNADVSGVPSEFSGLVADSRIEFRLAQRDPNCNPTNGITRTTTTESSFDFDPTLSTATARNPVKFDSSGGKDGWPSDKYLNFWICDLVDGPPSLLGYGSFPSDFASRPTEDGVVMDFEVFGTTGTVISPPFNLGRTTTHEIGHWLNLRHIWADDQLLADNCSRSDLVDDTPNQAVANIGCPAHPQNTCGSNDMFMNYMDYVDDDCMIMFSNGQSDRMDAVLYTTRTGIVSSQADLPPTAISEDLFMRDMADDIGDEPNTTSVAMHRSDDIWVRNSNDGFMNQEHVNAIGGATNYVYVRVRNRGCGTANSADVKLYWAKASSGLGWPAPWDGSVTSPALMGELIGQQPTGSLDGSEFVILEYSFVAPDPADYTVFGDNYKHFCLLARLETSATDPFGMTFPETGNLSENVRNNNNIVWKNITIDETSSGGRFSSVLVSNYTRENNKYRIAFEVPEGEESLFEYGKVTAIPTEKLLNRWKDGGESQNLIEFANDEFIVQEANGYIGSLILRPNESLGIGIKFEPEMKKLKYDRNVFRMDMVQYREDDSYVGAQSFTFRIGR